MGGENSTNTPGDTEETLRIDRMEHSVLDAFITEGREHEYLYDRPQRKSFCIQSTAASDLIAHPCSYVLVELFFISFASYAFDWVFHNPYCGLLFRCGCTWNWAGGYGPCNVIYVCITVIVCLLNFWLPSTASTIELTNWD